MKQQFVVTHRYTTLRETKKKSPILSRPKLKHVMFLRKYKNNDLFSHNNILAEGAFVTQLSSDAGVSDELCGLRKISK